MDITQQTSTEEQLAFEVYKAFLSPYLFIVYNTVARELDELLLDNGDEQDSEEETEFYEVFSELHSLFDEMPAQSTPEDTNINVNQFIERLSWENFFSEIEGEKTFYSLGSMYYIKLTWIIEGSGNENFVEFAKKLLPGVPPLLDFLETRAKLRP